MKKEHGVTRMDLWNGILASEGLALVRSVASKLEVRSFISFLGFIVSFFLTLLIFRNTLFFFPSAHYFFNFLIFFLFPT